MKTIHILHPCWHELPRNSRETLKELPHHRDSNETKITVTDGEWLILNIKYPDLQTFPTEVGNIWIEHND